MKMATCRAAFTTAVAGVATWQVRSEWRSRHVPSGADAQPARATPGGGGGVLTGGASPGGFQGGTVAQYATAAVASLQNWYDERTGLWAIPGGTPRGPHDPGWWNSANALHALIDYMHLTGTESYLRVAENTFDRHEASR